MKLILKTILFFSLSKIIYGQLPNYELIITNDEQINAMEYEFDINIRPLAPTLSFELAQLQLILTFDTLITSGSASFSFISGTSELLPIQQPTSLNIVGNELRCRPLFPPGSGNGTIINSEIKIGRFQITNNISFDSVKPDISWKNQGNPSTRVSAYVDGLNTDITNSDNHISLLNNPALPVELSRIFVKTNLQSILLSWETATEVNNRGFEIHRKSESVINWETIGFVKGNGNSNSPKEYSFVDKNPTGGTKFRYRLKQIDNDGTFAYSDEVEVELVPDKFELYQNYPNPFNPATNIKFSLPAASLVRIDVFNIIGEHIRTLINSEMEAGYHSVVFDASDLSSGTYIYRISAENFTQTKKMLLLK